MKKKPFFIALLTIATLFPFACTQIGNELLDEVKTSNQILSPKSNAFNVNIESVRLFASKVKFPGHSTMEIKNIEPIVYNTDTLFYFINYNNKKGWLVLSADKRTEPILASSETANIDKSKLGPSAVWYNNIAESVYALKNSDNRDSSSVHFSMWRDIEQLVENKKFKKKSNIRTRSGKPRDNRYDEEFGYDYEDILIDYEVNVVIDKKVDPLIKTKWGQDSPWDLCVPIDAETDTKCATGCVAVAGAQMLYYFHFKENKPAAFYSQGNCVGWSKKGNWFTKANNFNFNFSQPTTEVWDRMALTKSNSGSQYVSILMGFVGSQIDMQYASIENGGSSASTKDLVSFFKKMGVSSTYTDYNIQSVKNSLEKNLPVIISAKRTKERPKLGNIKIPIGWIYNNGHAWIIDGYTHKKIIYKSTYERRPMRPTDDDDTNNQIIKQDPDEAFSPSEGMEITDTSLTGFKKSNFRQHTKINTSESHFWKMNFGWNGGIADQGEYLTGDGSIWRPLDSMEYQYQKKIIHNFIF